MKIPISIRFIFAMNLIIAGFALVAAWALSNVSGDALQNQLVDERVKNAASMLGEMNIDPRKGVMENLAKIFDSPVIAVDPKSRTLLASSFDDAHEKQLRELFLKKSKPGKVKIGDQTYFVGMHDITFKQPGPGRPAGCELIAFIPAEKIEHSRELINQRIMRMTLITLVIVTLFSVGISITIARPIRKLAKKVDQISTELDCRSQAVEFSSVSIKTGPPEVVALGQSFDKLLQNLTIAEKELARTERLAGLGKISASVAHELRNPLSGIKMNVRVLADELTDPTQQEDLAMISREIERMDLYLQELMSLAKQSDPAKASFADLECKKIDLTEQVEQVLKLLSGRLSHSDIKLCRKISPQANAVWANPEKIRQVMINFFINAIEAMSKGGLATVFVTPVSGGTKFALKDSGPGVGKMTDLFEPFVSSKFDGAGLGLHICRQIIQAHKGEIGYESDSSGATFWFILPIPDANS